MTRLPLARLVVAALGVAVWGYGYRLDDGTIRVVGIMLLLTALLLRFLPTRPRNGNGGS